MTRRRFSHGAAGRVAGLGMAVLLGAAPALLVTAPAGAATAAGDPEAWRAPVPEQPEVLLVTHATIWTSGPQGKLEDADLLIKQGKIVKVGQGLTAPKGATVIDAHGKHVTPGIVDPHSHTAITGGVNEGTENVSAEVRIQDVVDPESISIYRELAGGVTCIDQLHGSANAIGGQNNVSKLRWGQDPDGMQAQGAMPSIKFALGENPKQSNWGPQNNNRYPQTRSGVEQLIRERFLAAKDYMKRREDYRRGKSHGLPPRRDLQLDALVEILQGKRIIHCHAYRADEMLMLMNLGDELGFKVGSFEHVLEGYKIANEMAAHGVAASTFSDWWAYKFEVYDAIPYNGAIMWDRGVLVAFNSDSDELARRLNLEAAKAVKYGGVPEEEALKFVTLNPAKEVGLGDRIGSLEPGKDADFVVWSGSPLSTYTVCEQTWIDGRKYFDRAEDQAGREKLEAERQALIEKIKASQKKEKGGKGKKDVAEKPGADKEPGSGPQAGAEGGRQ